MSGKRILYISGSLGLGHVVRDVAIAGALRRRLPEVEVSWLASPSACRLLRDAGERLHPLACRYGDEDLPAERAASPGFRLDILKYVNRAHGEWWRNIRISRQAVRAGRYDLVIADEAYELAFARAENLVRIGSPFAMIYDFFGCDSLRRSPLPRMLTYLANMGWVWMIRRLALAGTLSLFAGEIEDIPRRWDGMFLPDRRAFARAHMMFVGYVLPFEPADYADRARIRTRWGYGCEPLIVCAIGGTAIGRELLDLCGRAYRILRARIPNARMVLVRGPRLAPESLDVLQGVEVRGYVPALRELLAACDLAIVQGGGTTTLELTALRRPFLFFPLRDHFEQQVHVASRLERHRAGVRMDFAATTPESLARHVIEHIGTDVAYPPIPTGGAARAAACLADLLERGSSPRRPIRPRRGPP